MGKAVAAAEENCPHWPTRKAHGSSAAVQVTVPLKLPVPRTRAPVSALTVPSRSDTSSPALMRITVSGLIRSEVTIIAKRALAVRRCCTPSMTYVDSRSN